MDANSWELYNSKFPTQRLWKPFMVSLVAFINSFVMVIALSKKIGIISEHLCKRSFKQFFKYLKNNKEKYLETITDPTVILFQFNFIALKYNLITGWIVPFFI
jgi:hypothetical protein